MKLLMEITHWELQFPEQLLLVSARAGRLGVWLQLVTAVHRRS